jgi:hypothetical protein
MLSRVLTVATCCLYALQLPVAQAQQMDMEGLGGDLELQVQTTYPVVEVAQSCTGSRKAVPARTNTRPEPFGVISPVMFGMPLPDSDDLRISADKKAMIAKKNGLAASVLAHVARPRNH